jgi:hypothetical protein
MNTPEIGITGMGVLWQVGIVAAGFLLVAIPLWWCIPRLQMRSIVLGDPKARADIEDNFRKTVGQALGGIAVLIGAGLAYYGTVGTLVAADDQSRRSLEASANQSRLNLAASDKQSQRNFDASHALLISQQASKGFEQLGQSGADKLVLRLGGIYALEDVMNGSKEYRQAVLEALCAFIREGTKSHDGKAPPATDIQAALTVIGRRGPGSGKVDLRFAHIPNADLRHADLTHADLTNANLTDAKLDDATLTDGTLTRAILVQASMTRANLTNADLSDADLSRANLIRTLLTGASLKSAKLNAASLYEANLIGANLTGAKLLDTRLKRADLSSAKLPSANLTGAMLQGAT